MAVPTGNAHLFLRPLILAVLSLLLLASPFVSSVAIDSSDLKALQTIQTELGVNTRRSSFSSSGVNPCGRGGVSCERQHSDSTGKYILRVTRLVYRSRSLTGTISPVIGTFSELKELTLSDNKLVGGLPLDVVNCKKLEVLDVRNNRFSGRIPGIFSGLINLRILDLSSNKFSGNLNFLKNLRSLESLSVANNLFSGKIVEPAASFNNLRFFDFSGNRLLESPVPVMSKIKKLQTSLHQTRRILADNSTSKETPPKHDEKKKIRRRRTKGRK